MTHLDTSNLTEGQQIMFDSINRYDPQAAKRYLSVLDCAFTQNNEIEELNDKGYGERILNYLKQNAGKWIPVNVIARESKVYSVPATKKLLLDFASKGVVKHNVKKRAKSNYNYFMYLAS